MGRAIRRVLWGIVYGNLVHCSNRQYQWTLFYCRISLCRVEMGQYLVAGTSYNAVRVWNRRSHTIQYGYIPIQYRTKCGIADPTLRVGWDWYRDGFRFRRVQIAANLNDEEMIYGVSLSQYPWTLFYRIELVCQKGGLHPEYRYP